MAFFLTEKFNAPKPSRLFWLCHFTGWGGLALIDSLISILMGISITLSVFGFSLMLFLGTIVCLKLRELIYSRDLLSIPLSRVWIKLGLYAITLAFFIAANIRIALAIFEFISPEENIPEAFAAGPGFFGMLLMNWLSLSILIFFWGLIYVSVKYSNQLKEAKQASAELALELRNAQLNTLISQLNPHFLFNALNNIRGLMLEDVPRSREMLTRLAEMLRYSLLSDRQEFERLENELEVVRAYLKLASIQYEERLRYVEEIDTELLSYDIPPMLLQMLIENAIKYGIDQYPAGGEIKLSILSVNQRMVIHVSNPGELKQDNHESTGLGVKNIEKRLQLLYGQESSFDIRQEEDRVVTTVTFSLSKNGGEIEES